MPRFVVNLLVFLVVPLTRLRFGCATPFFFFFCLSFSSRLSSFFPRLLDLLTFFFFPFFVFYSGPSPLLNFSRSNGSGGGNLSNHLSKTRLARHPLATSRIGLRAEPQDETDRAEEPSRDSEGPGEGVRGSPPSWDFFFLVHSSLLSRSSWVGRVVKEWKSENLIVVWTPQRDSQTAPAPAERDQKVPL